MKLPHNKRIFERFYIMFEKLEQILDQFLEIGIPGNDCIVCKDGEVIYRKQRGYSNREEKIPMNGNEHYSIFSCSKPITCAAALQLWEKGKFGLDDFLCDYMPEFANMKVVSHGGPVPAQKKITIRNLFTMTAGFNYDCSSPSLKKCYRDTEGKCPTREAMKYLAKEPLTFEPGESWQYSLCHDVLAAFVEVVSGMEFNAYVTKNIFEPLGMNHSSYLYQADVIEKSAVQYLCKEPARFFVTEIIREKILLYYDKEIPYAVEVVVEQFKEEAKSIHINAVIYVERDSQKGIIIGKQGKALKKVSSEARKTLEKFFQKSIYLETFVKVDKDWRSSDKELKNFGYQLD